MFSASVRVSMSTSSRIARPSAHRAADGDNRAVDAGARSLSGAGKLFLVGTPIGNLQDMTDRARATLASVGLVAAEDTRRTRRLLAAFGVRARLVSLFEGNEEGRIPEVIGILGDGTDVALVSDAGMPTLSDPGYRLVATCIDKGIEVDVVPGPSAAVAALVVSGLPTDRFVFEGFLPRSGRKRAERLRDLAFEPRTTVLFESARRLASTLRELEAACGDRRVVVARELTKLHQEVLRGHLSDVLAPLGGEEPRGEIVVVLEGGGGGPFVGGDPEAALAIARALAAGGARKREAARRASELTGASSREIYERLAREAAASSGDGGGIKPGDGGATGL